tara:strand:+ start:556 stop:702 length:147 start_codon:yes stop_codon:yes gene_type:complete
LSLDHELYFVFMLAEHLGKTVDEIMNLTTLEIDLWSTYFDLKNERNKK